jgi:predicted MPP superfamily phosphohydrolase
LLGTTLGVISDLHLGTLGSFNRVQYAAAWLAKLKPDVTIIAGDLTSRPVAAQLLDSALAPLNEAYAILGNWDYRYPQQPRPQSKIKLLVNEGLEVLPGLWLGGVDDWLRGKPDIEMALAGAPAGAVRILLLHEPDAADYVQQHHRVALQISGHSHGGQACIPGFGPFLFPEMGRKYHTGLHRAPHCLVYTNRGLGTSHIPFRVLCPPEITLITIVN